MRMSRVAAVVVLFSAILSSVASVAPARTSAAAGDLLPFAATEVTLPNHLRVIVVPTGFPNLVSIQIPVQVGSRNEVEPGKTGFAHFFEHLMFRGTPSTPPEKFREVMSRAGARDNASTGADRTAYYATFAKEQLESVVALYADVFQHLSFSEADFKTEARAVLGEYNRNAANPALRLNEVQSNEFFQRHPYKHTTLGFVADIENMPNEYDYAKTFFARWYRPHATTVIVAGDVTAAQVLPLVRKYWGGWTDDTSPAIEIPAEPLPSGPRYAHAPWPTPTLPYVDVAFPSPAFDETRKEWAALDLLSDLYFGETSALYKRLVVTEQKVDQFGAGARASVDPSLFTVQARVKSPADAVYVRDQILATIAAARETLVPPQQLTDAKSHSRYDLARRLTSTEGITNLIAQFAIYRRSYGTLNVYAHTMETVTPADVQAVARRYFTDAGLTVTTLSHDPLPPAIQQAPALATIRPSAVFADAPAPPPVTALAAGSPGAAGESLHLVLQKSLLPRLDVKLLFTVGSAQDPTGKEGLAALTAAMIAEGGSTTRTIDQINAALYPMAGSFTARVDKEMTTFTGAVHRDEWARFFGTTLPQLLDPGFRDEDFARLKDAQLNALTQDLRSNNEEELGKERLQTNLFRGTPYGHVTLGTVAGIRAITIDDVRRFARERYTRANLTAGVSGDAPDEMLRALRASLARLPAGTSTPRVAVAGTRPSGLDVEILQKDTRSTAISLGLPIDVTRAHPDFVALSVARAWLGEHRISSGQLFQRIREIRGLNYGDYAYIEAFPRGMFQFFPDPNIARQRQIFEIWIRPVVPVNAHMTLRIALHELDALIRNGLTREQFETTRDYLLSNVYVMTAEQDQQLGYALDSAWYGIGEYTAFMRDGLRGLTLDDVNGAIKRHLSASDLSIVFITQDAAALKQALVADEPSSIKYDGEKPASLFDEDRVIGATKLHIAPDHVRITPIEEVFAQ
jgi:zinc protease